RQCLLRLPSLEGIAVAGLAAVDAAFEPACALCRGAVRERVRHHFAARLPLQGIVADRAGGGQGLLDVAGFENVARLVGMKGPDAGEAVGLQFQPYRQRIALYLRGVLASLV